jgi:hypothetical protein
MEESWLAKSRLWFKSFFGADTGDEPLGAKWLHAVC